LNKFGPIVITKISGLDQKVIYPV